MQFINTEVLQLQGAAREAKRTIGLVRELARRDVLTSPGWLRVRSAIAGVVLSRQVQSICDRCERDHLSGPAIDRGERKLPDLADTPSEAVKEASHG